MPEPIGEYPVLSGQMLTTPRKSRESTASKPHNNTSVVIVILWPAANCSDFFAYYLQKCSHWQQFLYVSNHTRTAIVPVRAVPQHQHAPIARGRRRKVHPAR